MKDKLKIGDNAIILDTEISRQIFPKDVIGCQGVIIENSLLTKLFEIFEPLYTIKVKYGSQIFPVREANECVQKIKD